MLNMVPQADRDKVSDLSSMFRYTKPGHASVENGIFGEGFAIVRELSPNAAVSIFDGVKSEYLREAWIDSDASLAQAQQLFEDLEAELDIQSLRESVEQ